MGTRDDQFAEAFGDLYALAWRAAMRVLDEPAAAEDVAAETLTRAYVRWPRMATFASAWVVRSATNLAIDGWRRRGRRPLASQGRVRDPAVTAAASVDLAVGLRTLPRRQREAVVLRHLSDLPEAAVAAAMGCSPGAVKQHTARGLAALRRALGESEE